MRRPLVRGVVFTAGGSGAVAVVSLVRNVLIAQVMGPAAFGLWNFCQVGLRLTVESHLGALSALSAEAPIHRGAGRVDDARRLERRALSLTVLLALVAGAGAAAALCVVGGRPLYVAAALLGATVVLQQQFFADSSILRSRGAFLRVAVAQVAFAAVHIAVLEALVPEHFLSGALVAWSVSLLVAVAVMRWRSEERLPPPVPSLGGGDLVRQGLPTYLVTVTFTLLLQADRVVVGAYLGADALGHYGVLGLGSSALLFLPDAFGGALWPLAGERFGRAGEDPRALSRITERSVRGVAILLAAALLVALAGTDLIVAARLPNFAAALPAMRPYLAGVYVVALTVPLRFLLLTTRAGRAVLVAQIGALIVAVALECGACAAGMGLTGVASASAVAAFALFGAMAAIATRRRLVTRTVGVRLVVEALLLVGGALALDAAIENEWLRLGVGVALGAAAAVLLARAARSVDS